jgi:hypothetical protein
MQIPTALHDLLFAFHLKLIRLSVAAEYRHYKKTGVSAVQRIQQNVRIIELTGVKSDS